MVSEHQIIAVIEQLERKIGLLKGVCEDAKRRVEFLEGENKRLRDDLKKQEDLAKRLHKNQANSDKPFPKSKEIGKIVSNNLSATDTSTELKQQLDEYIREIERCIAHLSSLS
ncbi:hypothetical protein DYU11_26285 [Fibrisoma montanum]|uniref:Uncharacterized protein n=1 Tax=Fibrisoma montanum TaxID=2305895 RepID=A0A418M005_9BACT|nr:hypothetical protein [Fibrisoma montanum]RIV19011.1 hypothetical protein DYU11_26285 [Fibrisoma montanum]